MKDDLLRLLRSRGKVPAQQVLKDLKISRATLSRLIPKVSSEVIRFGGSRASHYGALRSLAGIGGRIPLYRVTESGDLQPESQLLILHQNTYVIEPGGQIFEGLPPEFASMSPQGFMGRVFAQMHSEELCVPNHPQDWSNDHIITVIARRGEGLPGNLIVGKESAERWLNREPSPTRRTNYPELAHATLSGRSAAGNYGALVGGQQPKFTAFVDGRHCIVKFAEGGNSPVDQRGRDLLICESIALEVLKKSGIEVARTTLQQVQGGVYLEIERFDRVGVRGQRPVLTLAAIDDSLFKCRDGWTNAADRLEQMRIISREDSYRIKFLDAFGSLIGDYNRHFYNIAFFPEPTHRGSLTLSRLKLAPAFDKLPMYFAPVAGKVIDREFQKPIPSANLSGVWQEALKLALDFWKQVSNDSGISSRFRAIAKECSNILT